MSHCALLALVLLAAPSTGAATTDRLERAFTSVSPESRKLLGPLFWLHGDDTPERLRMYVRKVAEGGNGCLTLESRPHSDWLGPGWWRDVGICLAEAKKRNLQVWLFDEKWWPSGEVAGKVPLKYGSKRLRTTVEDVTGPAQVSLEGFAGADYIAAVAGRVEGDAIVGSTLVELAPYIRGGRLNWSAPEGPWRVVKFTFTHDPGRQLVDGASRDAVDWYIRTVYQPHYDRFKADFGKTIRGYFYDEPETKGDWGTEVMRVLAERGIDWKKALVARTLKLAGEEQTAAAYQYQDALAEAWGRTLYGGLSDWCRARGVKSMGHFLEHGNAYLAPDLCAGNMMQLIKYSDMGGIDAVFDQFVWGKRETRDNPIWQTPKLGSSVTHAYGKPDDVTMVEIYGARGQDLSYPEMKWWLDAMQVAGVNFVIPHSFNPRAPRDTDCPPYFYNGGYEPRWPLYKVFADYSARLSGILSGGKHVAPVALLYLGNSAHAGRAVTPERMSEALQDALYDCDWIPYDVFTGPMQVRGRSLALRDERYRVLVVPPVETLPYDVLTRVRDFHAAGGVVVAHGFLPSKSATMGKTSADIAALVREIWGSPKPGLGVCKTTSSGGRSYLLPERPTPAQLQLVLAGDAGVRPTLEVLRGDTGGWLHVLHRVKDGRDVFFVTNQNHTGAPRDFRFRVTAAGVPERWDAMRGTIAPVPFVRTGASVDLDMRFEPNESALIVFRRGARPSGPAGRVVASVVPERLPWNGPAGPPPIQRGGMERELEGLVWVWSPGSDARSSAPPGSAFFRKVVTIPAGAITSARFVLTADNSAILTIDGKQAGASDQSGEGWRAPVTLDVTKHVHAGALTLGITAVNATDRPSPAGLIGKLTVTYAGGRMFTAPIDKTWRCGSKAPNGWSQPGFADSDWPTAREIARFGDGPWGRLGGGGITLGPVKARPYRAAATLDARNLRGARVWLEMSDLKPEEAARVTVNGSYAGGCIGRPLRVDVTAYVKAGRNEIKIEPCAPGNVRLAAYR